MENAAKTLRKGTRHFFTGTVLSRITGLIREMAMAALFGTHPSVAGFFVAFRWANFFRRFLGEGALLSGFVPHFSALADDPVSGAHFLRRLHTALLGFFALFLPLAIGGLGWGGHFLPEEYRSIIQLTQILMPSLLFLSLYTVAVGYLHTQQRFLLSSFAPVGLNLVWIAGTVALSTRTPESAMPLLALTLVGGYAVQWLLVAGPTLRFMGKRPHPNPSPPSLRPLLKSLTLGMVGVGAVQLNSALDGLFAYVSHPEGPAYLTYAIRPHQLPLALFSIAIGSVSLPLLTKAHEEGAMKRVETLLSSAYQQIVAWIVPATAAMIALGGVGINLLYGRGAFGQEATRQTTLCLWGYAVGLLPMSFAMVLAPAFYAKKDFYTPTIASLLSVAVNLILNGMFVFFFSWGPASLALATSLAACIQVAYLQHHLTTKPVQGWLLPLLPPIIASGLAALAAIATLHYAFGHPWPHAFDTTSFPRTFSHQLAQLILPGLFFIFPLLALRQTSPNQKTATT